MMQIFIDFDGVLVDSNHIKTFAFREVAVNHLGLDAANELVSFHLSNPGKSRFEKFVYIIDKYGSQTKVSASFLIDEFGRIIEEQMLQVKRSTKVPSLLSLTQVEPHVLTAAPQDEVIKFINMFGWNSVFGERVHGAPYSKSQNLAKINLNKEEKNILIGDSHSDLSVALEYGFDFAFISNWTPWIPKAEEASKFIGEWETLDSFLGEYFGL